MPTASALIALGKFSSPSFSTIKFKSFVFLSCTEKLNSFAIALSRFLIPSTHEVVKSCFTVRLLTFFKFAPVKPVSVKLANSKLLPVKSASVKSALFKTLSNKSDPVKSAPAKSALAKLASKKSIFFKSAPSKLLPPLFLLS